MLQRPCALGVIQYVKQVSVTSPGDRPLAAGPLGQVRRRPTRRRELWRLPSAPPGGEGTGEETGGEEENRRRTKGSSSFLRPSSPSPSGARTTTIRACGRTSESKAK